MAILEKTKEVKRDDTHLLHRLGAVPGAPIVGPGIGSAMTRLRFYTEYRSAEIDHAITHHLIAVYGGLTTYLTLGAWLGRRESSTVYEVLVDMGPNLPSARETANVLRRLNTQDCVLYTTEAVQGEFVYA